jgi:hypothetical protein
MPEAAISSGLIDLALPIEQLGPQLAQFADGYVDAMHAAARGVDAESSYNEIYALLQRQVGHDFSGYKLNTFHRRVHRRMQICHIGSLEQYVELLRSDTAEVTMLFRELLIGVTTFFRDNEAFDALARQVIPSIIEGKDANQSVRIWVPGCATGEEAYQFHRQPDSAPERHQGGFRRRLDRPNPRHGRRLYGCLATQLGRRAAARYRRRADQTLYQWQHRPPEIGRSPDPFCADGGFILQPGPARTHC